MRARQRVAPKRPGGLDLPLTSTTTAQSPRRRRRIKKDRVDYLTRIAGCVVLIFVILFIISPSLGGQPSPNESHPPTHKRGARWNNHGSSHIGPVAKIKNKLKPDKVIQHFKRNPGVHKRINKVHTGQRVSDSGSLEILFRKAPGSNQIHQPPALTTEDRILSLQRDYGNLTISFFEDESSRRTIYRDDYFEGFEIRTGTGDDFFDFYYSFDDDEARNPYNYSKNKTLAKTHHCRRTSWHRKMKQDCNKFHEVDLLAHVRTLSGAYLG